MHEKVYSLMMMMMMAPYFDDDDNQRLCPACGFTLLQQEKPSDTDWTDLNSIRETYLPRVRDALFSVYGGDDDDSSIISDIIFWCPTLRIENATQTPRDNNAAATTPNAGYVATAHIDTDVNAYQTVQDFVNIIIANQFPGTTTSLKAKEEELVDALSNTGRHRRRRFAIVNAWRNIGHEPIERAPLALLPSRYVKSNTAFPAAEYDSRNSHWYTYPHMTPNELLLFLSV